MSDSKTPVFQCPEHQQAFAKSYAHANSACELITEYGTPPLPNTFALMYAYAAQSDESVVIAVNEMLERGSFSQYEIDQVYNMHLGGSDDAEKREGIGREVEQQLSSVLDLVGTGVENSDQFELAPKQIQQAVSNSDSTAPVSAAITRLLSENQRMSEQSHHLIEGLQESKRQIERLQKELETVRNESLRDPLTKIYNRRAFDMRLSAEIDSASKQQSELCLAIADLDHFKRVNDTFGHRVGDEILKIFASVITSNIKGQDLVARYGGEEFAIILPATNLTAATQLIDRIRVQMSERRLVLKGTKTPIGDITASFGLARFSPGTSSADLIEQADKKLYLAKSNGRNRVESGLLDSHAA